ncbi:MAG: ABC transporter permease [Desulfobacterales bacterium]|jgi:simple sugar transport system permease protein|nr:ABC transporter permease [Desulfobacterales bacterium]
MTPELTIALLAAAVQSGTPILYATLGEIFTERAGVLNLGVEGIMLIGALAGFIVAKTTGVPVYGLLAGGLCGALLAAVHGLLCLVFQGNQVVSGLALTILGTGLSSFWGTAFIGQRTVGFEKLPLPLLSEIPVLGDIFFQHDPLIYLSYLLAPLMWAFLRYTRWGLGLRAVGESPAAAAAAGLRVLAYRWAGVLVGGVLMGFGGAYLSLAYTHLWTNGLSAGRGWIAVALVIFTFWRPGRAILGAYLFGGVMAFQLRLQAMGTTLPSSLLLMLPYSLTIAVLVFSSWRGRGSEAPAALGVNIEPRE